MNQKRHQKNQTEEGSKKPELLLWILTGALLLGLLFARVIYPELVWLSIAIGLPLLGALGALVMQNQKALKSRGAAYGLNSVVTVALVIGIVGVLDFLTSRYPLKWDLTKNKVHTLSEQSVKLIKGLQKPIKVTFFSKLAQRDQAHALLDNYRSLNPKFEVEYVDPDREPTRAKQAGIKKYGTLLLEVGARENRIEDPTEEKLTNSLIKLLKEKTTTLCAVTGHGEKNFSSQESDGYEAVKKLLTEQAYEVKELNIVQEGKIPETCDGIAIIGPTKAFFEAETKAIRHYLEDGGRAVVAVDMNLKGAEFAPELLPLLEEWHVKANSDLVVDPLSRMLGVDASVAILASFSKDQAITKEFQGNCFFPFTRSLAILPSAPPSLHVQWIAQTTPKSWSVADLKQLTKGEVRFTEGKDKQGPLDAAIAVEGKQKDSKSTKNTRLVVFGTSFFATNNFSRYGGNLDFFLNSVAWVVEDESLISIRAKEEAPGKVELSQKSGAFIFMLTVIVVPLLIAVGGLVIWIFRRRM
jgi:ABC-type uncharacterized transport system involved in gliding motility auxiliary subunit